MTHEKTSVYRHRRHNSFGNIGLALSPALSAYRLLRHVPEISRICDVDTLQLFTVDSTNITPYTKQEIKAHRCFFEKGNNGVLFF